MNYTSIEQSKKLVELGLNPDSADMYYTGVGDIETGEFVISEKTSIIEVGKGYKGTLPCWSVGALFTLLPKIENIYYANLYKASYAVEACGYIAEDGRVWKIFVGEDCVDACYKMAVFLLENGYIMR